MNIRENIKNAIITGYEEASNKLNEAAGKVREMGAKGKLEFEIMQIGNKIQNKMPLLGSDVYDLFREKDLTDIAKADHILKLLNEIKSLEKEIEEKEKELQQYE